MQHVYKSAKDRRAVVDGTPVHSFSTLMAELGSNVRNTCRTPGASPEAPTFETTTIFNATQRHALDLIRQIQPWTKPGTRTHFNFSWHKGKLVPLLLVLSGTKTVFASCAPSR
jgi:hypothetical protein